jgi:8-oxo-dGTP diphosphatase
LLHVAIGVIRNSAKQCLMTTRISGRYKGFWEFPGGKIESGETPKQALIRELKEEIGVTVQEAEYLTKIEYAYPNHTVLIEVFEVKVFAGMPMACEGQQLNWFDIINLNHDLENHNFLPTTVEILSAL